MMKKIILVAFILFSVNSFSNNIQLYNVSLTGQNTALDYTMVEFDISWDNSWRTSTMESNWDAAWVFIKYRRRMSPLWNHATLSISGHTAPAGSTITPSADGKGSFIYRSANGIGNTNWNNVQLRWNYGVDFVNDWDSVEVCVFAIEMVYIPQGPFFIGDNTSSTVNGQFEAGTSGLPYQITSEASKTLGGGAAGSIGNHNATGMVPVDDFNNTTSQSLPLAFPKGFNAFYIMKYEITQEQYMEFLNKLTLGNQGSRTVVSVLSPPGTNALGGGRNGIDILIPGLNPTPAVYAYNLDGDGNYNEPEDGQNIACGFLLNADISAYLDWSGLRPMTELEYEKACRGSGVFPLADEYAWGGTVITNASGLINPGLNNEIPSNAVSNCNSSASLINGPIRVGSFAQAATNRQSSGGSFYGVMELTGNVEEQMVAVSNAASRAFNGTHGNGTLAANGSADAFSWPVLGIKGGNWSQSLRLRVSDRTSVANPASLRDERWGGRGVRTAP